MSLSSNVLSILFKVQGYMLTDVRHASDRILLTIVRTEDSRCPYCGTVCPRYDSHRRTFFIGSLNGTAIDCLVQIYRVDCPHHHVIVEDHGISEGHRHYSKAAGATVVHFTRYLDNASAARLLGMSQSTVYRIDREVLGGLLTEYRKSLPNSEAISVDEVAYKRGHHYATVVSDHTTGTVLWLEKKRTGDSLKNALTLLPSAGGTIRTVTMDFWKPYETATREILPNAAIVYDRFHLTRLLNRAIENQRRAYQRDLPDAERKVMKKQSRWVLLKREKNLSEMNRAHLEALKQVNEPLFDLYMMKESFLAIFDEAENKKEARSMIFTWIREVRQGPFKFLKSFAKSLLKRMRAVLSWFENPVSNGKAEGINNVIKTLLKRAYGYKDFDYFRVKVLQHCGNLMNYATHTN